MNVRLRAERKLGEILTVSPKNTGAAGIGPIALQNYEDNIPTRAQAGISYNLSSRAQMLASVPPEIFEAALIVEDGEELNHNRVAMELKRALDRSKRQSARADAVKAVDIDQRILVGDFRNHANKIADGSLSLIFTDPPYDHESIPLFENLGSFAKAKLAKGGSLICYVGHIQLPAVLPLLKMHLRYWWTLVCLHTGGPSALMREYGIRVGWKPMLWFVKETRDDKTNIVVDVVSGNQEKDYHDWQQSEIQAAYWIEKLCPEDGIVCDPFLGGGTTAAAAESLGRKWIGMEIDPQTAAIASARLGESHGNGTVQTAG
jgi:hypothetical protein